MELQLKRDLVSIIMPAYNCEEFIETAIVSVLDQTYPFWELIIVDDCSTDNTWGIIHEYSKLGDKIITLRFEENSGAAHARNSAIDLARGEYIAFLDSDDIWNQEKLEKQISFMKSNNYYFTCTSYDKVDENGNSLNRKLSANIKSDYSGVLKTCPGNSTVIYNASQLGKFKISKIKKRNDYLMWLQVIKKAKYLYGLEQVLGSHRIRKNAISSNKLSLISYHWRVYRKEEKLNFFYSSYLVTYWCLISALKLR